MPKSFSNLLELCDLVECQGSPELIRWFENEFPDYLKACHANAWRRARRNECITAAFNLIAGKSERARRHELLIQTNRFICGAWPRWRNLEAPPARATKVQAYLFRAAKTGLPLPDSESGIRHVLESVPTTPPVFGTHHQPQLTGQPENDHDRQKETADCQ